MVVKTGKTYSKMVSKRYFKKNMAKAVSKTNYSYDKMLEMLAPLSKKQIIQQMDIAYGQFAIENQDMEFPFPVLILLGEEDKVGKVKNYCKVWAKETGYPLHIISGAGHFANGDNPEQVNKEIEEFIRELSLATQ